MRYKVRATMHGKRLTTSKYWEKKSGAQKYADATNKFFKNARARVVKYPKKKK